MNRDLTIDVLRFIGISLIILAHVLGPGSLLFQIRSFDVPLMVFVSGLANSGKKMPDYGAYISKRLTRLIIPVWLFYTVYFIIEYICFKFGAESSFPGTKEIINTFLCVEGYGWIIRVFLLIMLVAPFISWLESKISDWLYGIIILTLIIIHAILFPIYDHMTLPRMIKRVIDLTLPYLLGYLPAYMIGIKMRKANIWQILVPGVLFLAAFAFSFYMNISVGAFDLESYKWPPQFPFICYGVGISCLLYSLKSPLALLTKVSSIVFIGQNTIWIYLWHILALAFVFKITDVWPLQYVIVFSFAIAVFFIQYSLVKNKPKHSFTRKFLVG